MIIPIILAGGSGTRLWPLSRELYPKQLLSLVDGNTMLQNTVNRLSGVENMGEPIVICNEQHRFLVAEQLRAIGVKPSAIILEPIGRNTAPAVATAALSALEIHPDAVLLVLPADHHMEDVGAFHNAVHAGYRLASEQYLVTFGIVPQSPETGYGYIQRGEQVLAPGSGHPAMKIRKFVEKPDRATAQTYLDSGDYLWNSGMFMFRASSVLEEMDRFTPEITASCRRAYEKGLEDLDFFRLDLEAFTACPSDSVDYAVMERTEKGVIIPLDAGWNDLGSWDALWEVQPKGENDNVMVGDVISHDVKRSYVHATSRLVAAIGLDRYIVIETADAVLISPWDRVQEVKALVQQLKSDKREEAVSHRKVYRPWGSYECLSCDTRFQVKRIIVKPGARLSLQKHMHRAEHWVVVRGTAIITVDDKEVLLKEDESTYIPLGINHRLENPGRIPLELIEVQSGSYLGEDDIIRLGDIYGRTTLPAG